MIMASAIANTSRR